MVLAPIVPILLEPVIFARLVFGEFERAGADRRIVGRVLLDVSVPRRRASAPRWSAPASALRISWNGVGLAKRNTAVCSSGVSTASRSLNTVRPRFCSGFQTCSAENATSAEVKGLPSCHLTPSRSLNVTDRPSVAPSQLVASRGSSPSLPSKEASASGSTNLLEMKKTPLDATIAGLRLRGSESAATTSRPPFFGVCAQPIVGSAVEASSSAEPASTLRLEIVTSDMIELRPSQPLWPGWRIPSDTGRHPCKGDYEPCRGFRQRRIWRILMWL